jgi:hypothetical protein
VRYEGVDGRVMGPPKWILQLLKPGVKVRIRFNWSKTAEWRAFVITVKHVRVP